MHFYLRNIGVPPRTREGHSRMSTFLWKKRWCRNDKNGPLENVHFVLENAGEAALGCMVFSGQSAFFRMSSIPLGISGATGRLPFFTRRGSNFLRLWIILKEKGDPPGRRLARRTCEGPARRTDSGERRREVFTELG